MDPSALRLEVVDDGHGFAESGIGVGLLAMRERADELGGVCEITSATGEGTTVSVRLPRHEQELLA